MSCEKSDIQDHIINIKTFKNYLEKIIDSIENYDNINERHIITLSKTITNYYRELHNSDSDDENDIELLDNSSNDASEMELDDKSKFENSTESDDDLDNYCLVESLKEKKEKKEEKEKANKRAGSKKHRLL